MAPEGVSVHAARVPIAVIQHAGAIQGTLDLEPVRAFADPPAVDTAAELLAAAPLNAIAFASTSTSYVRGQPDDAILQARLERSTRGIPVVITCSAAALALKTLGIARMGLVDPPWFSAELNEMGAAYFRAAGFEVVYSEPAALPAGPHPVQPELLYEWVRSHVPPDVEAVFIAGNSIRAVGVVQALEEGLGRPVLTANQVAFWAALGAAGAGVRISRYGRIFEVRPPGGVPDAIEPRSQRPRDR